MRSTPADSAVSTLPGKLSDALPERVCSLMSISFLAPNCLEGNLNQLARSAIAFSDAEFELADRQRLVVLGLGVLDWQERGLLRQAEPASAKRRRLALLVLESLN